MWTTLGNPLNAPPVDVGKANQIGREVTVGIVATRFGHQFDAGNVELANASRLVWRHLALDPNEEAVCG